MWKYSLSFVMWVWGIQFTSSSLVAGAFTHWAISPVLYLSLFKSRGSSAESTHWLTDGGSVETTAAKDRPPSAFPGTVTAISTRTLLQLLPAQDFCDSLGKSSKFKQQQPTVPHGFIHHCPLSGYFLWSWLKQTRKTPWEIHHFQFSLWGHST